MNVFTLIEIILGIYCTYFVAYNAIFTLASFFYKAKNKNNENRSYQKIAVLVPAYRCDEVILGSVRENLKTNYPHEFWKLFVIADGLQEKIIRKLKLLSIHVVEVSFKKSTKVKSLKACLKSKEIGDFENVVILDADNIMDKQFLHYMNEALMRNQSIQGRRDASNQNNSLAILDGISEALNINTFRKGPEVFGLSVSLAGSGMAFKKDPLKKAIASMDSIGGFDRELEFELLSNGIRSCYVDEAIVYDEKTDEIANFKNQRTRWISSQFYYLRKYFWRGLINLFDGRFTYFHSTILRNLSLPRALNIGLLSVLFILSLALSFYEIGHWKFWTVLFGINVAMTVIAIPKRYFNRDLIGAFVRFPSIVFSMFLILFRLKNANKNFIHTKHIVRK